MPSKIPVFAKERIIAAFLSGDEDCLEVAQILNVNSSTAYQTSNNSWKMQSMGTVRTFIPTFLPGKRKNRRLKHSFETLIVNL